MKLLDILKIKENFSPTEQVIIDYVMEHYQDVASLSARDLAEKTYTSSAAVVRLSQKIGLKGYAEFKIKFTSEVMRVSSSAGFYENSITNKDSILSILDKVARIEIEAIQETKNEINVGQIIKAIHLIDQAEHIDFYAMDNNLRIAKIACYCFLHAGKLSTVNSAVNAQYVQALASPKSHVAFIISRTGENNKLIEIAEILKTRKVKMILVTAVKPSSLTQLCDETLWVSSEREFNELGTMVFLSAAKYMFDVLFSVLFAKHYESTLSRNEFFEKIFRV